MNFFIPNRIIFFTFLVAGGLLTACNKDKNDNKDKGYNVSGNASGGQVNPTVATTGSASLTGTYSATTNLWHYEISWNGLSGTASAVQLYGPADIGVNGSLIISLTITTAGSAGVAMGNVLFTDQQETEFLAGKYYYIILTPGHAGGELRGQITAIPQ